MYFVRYGDICVRFTGKNWDERELPEFTSVYDYDDEKKYSLDDLERESRRTDFGGAGRDEDAHAAVVMELFRRKGGEENCLCTDWDDTLTLLEDGEGDLDDRRPIIYPDELSLPTRKLIADVAKLEHEEMAFRKKHMGKKPEDIDEATQKEFLKLDHKGWKIREALLDSDLGQEILEAYDSVEDLKTMAAQMFFLYSQTRMRAETDGGESEEDFFYAGSNLYAHAVADQIMEEGDEGEDDYGPMLDDESRQALDDLYDSFGDLVNEDDEDFAKGMDEATDAFLKDKGFDITNLAGAKAAQKFLENAGPEDAFVTEGPVDNEMDAFMGKMRLEAMLKCVKARIDQMIGGKK